MKKDYFQRTVKKIVTISFILLALSFFLASPVKALQAFPTAEGFGSDTIGGRGGNIIRVTNLNDGGAGSFREACNTAGARVIIFDVSGTIFLNSTLSLENDYVTIAGQTSPGGIAIAGASFLVEAHDVIIRHMRFRVGSESVDYATDINGIIYYDNPQYDLKVDAAACLSGNSLATYGTGMPCALTSGTDPETLDGVMVVGSTQQSWYPGADAHNVIFDHCSFSWGVDETLTVGIGAHDVTIQNSIVAEGLQYAGHPKGEHSKGILLSNKFGGINRVSVHKNFFTSSQGRQPLISGDQRQNDDFVDVRNNVIQSGYKNGNSTFENTGAGNAINNWFKKGVDSYATYSGWNAYDVTLTNHIYHAGNRGSNLNENTENTEWNIQYLYPAGWASLTYRKAEPFYISPEYLPVTYEATEEFADSVIENVGATVPVEDAVDQRLKVNWVTNIYFVPRNIIYPDDYPTYSTPAPSTDTDTDGIPDSWEAVNGTNPSIIDDVLYTNTLDSTYTNIEAYINDLAGDYEQASTIRADVDQQNGINSTDAMLTLRYSLGLNMTSTNWQASATTGDVNCDDTTSSTDAMLILRQSLGLDMGGTGWCVN